MKAVRIAIGIVLGIAVLCAGWVVLFHSEWLKPALKGEEPEPVTEVPVHVAKITRATLHKYVECQGSVGAAQLYAGVQPSTARIASPVAGIVTSVACSLGQVVMKGAALFELDPRVARAEESKAEAALASAQAARKSAQSSLLKLKSSTRPEQISIAEIALKKARQAAEFATQNNERQKALAKDELSSVKQLEETASALAGAREDQTSAEKQLLLLKNTPPPEELAEAEAKITEAAAKINEAEKVLAGTQLQTSLLKVKAPIDGTVVRLNVYPGESVDVTTVIVELVDLNRLEISASVPSSELKFLKLGQQVKVYCAVAKAVVAEKDHEDEGDNEAAFACTLTAMGQQVDPKTDLATVRVALPQNSGVQPGQIVRLRITVDEHRDCLVVPEECVFRDKTNIEVIAVVENEKSGLQNVKVGLREKGWVEISGEDIKEGLTVVAAGAYGLPEETRVRILTDKAPAREKK